MSLESAQLNYLEDVYANFHDALGKGRLDECRNLIFNLVEGGYEKEAKTLAQELVEDKELHESNN